METRARSFWAWGWTDRLPDDTARSALAAQAGALLGIEALRLRALPRIDDVVLRPARITSPPELAGFCTSEPSARITHTYGRGYRDLVRGLHGDFASAPDVVALARDEADVVAVLAWCARERVACVPYGGGTSVVGGVEGSVDPTYRGVLSLDVRALDRVLEIDTVSRAARIQAGAMGPAIEAQLAPHGLTLRHYPQSFEFSTLGGWIATRAGGHYATLYTHIDDMVESIRMVTPAGVWQSPRVPASGAGPSPDRMVLGSEGALGVITEAWVRLQQRPRWRLAASVRFGAFARAVDAARAVSQAGLYPANCRVLDPAEALLNRVADDGSAVLLLGFESGDHAPEEAMARALALCTAHGGTASDGVVRREGAGDGVHDGASGRWRAAFLDAPYLQSALVSVGVLVDTFETCCTWDRFDALHADVTAGVTEALVRTCGAGRVTCRFTHVYPDGPAPYYTFVGPAREGDELAQWATVKAAASEALLRHGATVTHHHAVGRVHRPWYDRERPAPFALALRAMKAAVDPAAILNPGVLVDP